MAHKSEVAPGLTTRRAQTAAKTWGQCLWRDIKVHRSLLLMFVPCVVLLILFRYIPMYGVQIAFRKFTARGGITHSPWVGLKNLREFFNSYYAGRVIVNTILLNVLGLTFGFPATIIFALMLNEVAIPKLKRIIQTISYFPHFVAVVVVAGMAQMLLSTDTTTGVVNSILTRLGMEPVFFFGKSEWFRPIYIITGIWQSVGWGAILYLAALAGVDLNVYEAAIIDGANRFQLIRHVTIPALVPTMVIVLILNLSGMLSSNVEKILALYNPLTYETGDVIGSFVYRRGIIGESGLPDYSYATAVGLFQSLIGLVLIITANQVARKVGDTSLW